MSHTELPACLAQIRKVSVTVAISEGSSSINATVEVLIIHKFHAAYAFGTSAPSNANFCSHRIFNVLAMLLARNDNVHISIQLFPKKQNRKASSITQTIFGSNISYHKIFQHASIDSTNAPSFLVMVEMRKNPRYSKA